MKHFIKIYVLCIIFASLSGGYFSCPVFGMETVGGIPIASAQISGQKAESVLNTLLLEPDLNCDPDFIFSQLPDHDNAVLSDEDFFYQAFDDFSGLTQPVISLNWWGVELLLGYDPCERTNMEFQVGIYPPDAGGLPDRLNPYWEGYLLASRVLTSKTILGDLPVYKYSVDLPAAVSATEGWFSVHASVDPDSCLFAWAAADHPSTHGYGCFAWSSIANEWTPEHIYDLAFCLIGEVVPTPTPTPAPPTHTPVPTNTPVPPTATPTDPGPTHTPKPPTATPTPECGELGCTVYMPSDSFSSGDICYVEVYVCNTHDVTYTNVPIFVILDVYGMYFFAPSFGDFDFYAMPIEPGMTTIQVLPPFEWPADVGSASGIIWYAAMTDPEITDLFGGLGMFTFGWH